MLMVSQELGRDYICESSCWICLGWVISWLWKFMLNMSGLGYILVVKVHVEYVWVRLYLGCESSCWICLGWVISWLWKFMLNMSGLGYILVVKVHVEYVWVGLYLGCESSCWICLGWVISWLWKFMLNMSGLGYILVEMKISYPLSSLMYLLTSLFVEKYF